MTKNDQCALAGNALKTERTWFTQPKPWLGPIMQTSRHLGLLPHSSTEETRMTGGSTPATTTIPMASTPTNKPATDKLPALAPERSAIDVEFPSSEHGKLLRGAEATSSPRVRKNRHDTKCNETQRRPAHPVVVPLPERIAYYEVKLYSLTVLMLLNAMCWRAFVIATPTRWADAMTTAGFIDWTPFPDKRVETDSSALAIPFSGMVILLMRFVPRTHPHLLKLYYAISGAAIFLSSIPLFCTINASPCLPSAAVDALVLQEQAVATYNYEYCQVWCRQHESGLVLLTKGECSKLVTVFDEISKSVEVGNWCKEAIEKNNFELLADYSGLPPFAGLKGAGGCAFEDVVTGSRLFMSVMSALSSWAIAIIIFLSV